MTGTNSSNLFNHWQKFCSIAGIPKSEVKPLYDLHKNELQNSNPSTWFNLFKKKNNNQTNDDDKNNTNSEWSNHQQTVTLEPELLKDIHITLREIKQFLIHLSCEPSRSVESFFTLESITDQKVLDKWAAGLSLVMSKLTASEDSQIIIDLNSVYELISEHLFKVNLVNIVEVKFYHVTDQVDINIKILFDSKREKYPNEIVVPVITKNSHNQNVVYFFYNLAELLSVINRRFKTEHKYYNEYVKTTISKSVEKNFYITQMVYIVLHALIHLKCSIEFKDAYLSHEDANYFKTVESIVPRSLYKYFLQPNFF